MNKSLATGPTKRPRHGPLPYRQRTAAPGWGIPPCTSIPPPACDNCGWLGLNNLRANGPPRGGPWRQFHGTACTGFWPEHPGTMLHGQQAEVALIVRVVACLAEALGIRVTARGYEVEATTVGPGLGEAAVHRRAFSASFLCQLPLEPLQRDELSAVIDDRKAGESRAANALERLEPLRLWVWTALAPVSKWLVAREVGPRTLEM